MLDATMVYFRKMLNIHRLLQEELALHQHNCVNAQEEKEQGIRLNPAQQLFEDKAQEIIQQVLDYRSAESEQAKTTTKL